MKFIIDLVLLIVLLFVAHQIGGKFQQERKINTEKVKELSR